MSAWSLYWMLRCDDIRQVIGSAGSAIFILAVACFVAWLIVGMAWLDTVDDKLWWKSWRRCLYFIVAPLLVFGIITGSARAFIPTTKQMATIYVVPKMVNYVDNNEALKSLPGKVIDLANEWVDELSPKKNVESKESN